MTRKKLALIVSLLSVACGRSVETSADSASTSPATPVAASLPVDQPRDSSRAKAACPHTGLWAICSFENRVRQSGFVARRVEGEAPKRLGFSVEPVIYTLGKSRLEVFIYPDEAALARDVAKMDTVTVAPIGSAGSWETPPLLIRSGNLAAVLLSQNPRQAERLTLALTAGAPQPGSPR